MYYVDALPKAISIGKQGEGEVTSIQFDVSAWINDYPGLPISISMTDPRDSERQSPYLVSGVTLSNGILTWLVGKDATQYDGLGTIVIRCADGDVDKRSACTRVIIDIGHGAAGDTPEPMADWLAEADALRQEVADGAAAAADSADTATTKAGEAASSAQAASTSAGQADTAKLAAESARDTSAAKANEAGQSAQQAAQSAAVYDTLAGTVAGHTTQLADIALRNSNIVITSAPIIAPYNDLNTMPIGSIVGYALYVSSATVAHLPSGVHQGAVTTLAYTRSGASIICQQMQSETKLAYRTRWGEAWSEWKILASTADIPVLPTTLITGDRVITTTPTAPYNDMNTLPSGGIVTYAAYVSASLLHRPTNFHQGTVLTIAYSNADSTSITQMAFSAENVMSCRVKWAGVWSTWRDVPDTETIHTYDMTSLSLFNAIGVVGDSFASGATYGISGAADGEHYDVSWPAILGRMTGCTISNYSSGGLSTRTWLTDTSHGLPQLINDSAKNLYLLALGINDASLGAGYMGTVSDIHDADCTLNADTFYGNYGRIVAQIIAHSPAAKIVFVIPPQFASSGVNAAWYAAMVAISGHYNMPYIASANDVFFATAFYTASLSTGHPIAITYAGMAQAYSRLMAQCMQANVLYFRDYAG